MVKRLMLFLALSLLITMLTACSTLEPNEPVNMQLDSKTPEQSTVSEETPEPIMEEPAPIEGDFQLPSEGVRPIAVMIDNEGTKSLPQGGIDKAQIIYEVTVEGGETRLMPLFWGTDPQLIGPVRSSRDYFLDYSMEYDAIYVHFGWSPQAKADIPKLKINNINGLYVGNDVIWDLTKDKNNWQDSYTSMEKLLAYAGKMKYNMTTDVKLSFKYSQTDVVPINGESAAKISMKYSSAYTCGYEYDSATGLYKRFRNGKPQMERVRGKQLDAKNIIIQYTPNYDIKGDKQGRQGMNTVGSGKGYLITGGKAVNIKWSKESRRAQTSYTDEAGNDIMLNRGQTWIQIIPLTSIVTME